MSNKHYNQGYFKKRDHLDLIIAESIKILMKDNHLKKVLDVGCGTGRLVEFLNKNGFEAIGCDHSEEAVRISGQIMASAANLPFENESFDLVTAISIIEHLTKKEARDFVSEAYRVLKPSGFIFLITPNFASPLRLIRGEKWFGYSDPTHITFFTPKTLSRLLKSYRFKNITLRFKIGKNVKFDWHLPEFFRKLPSPVKHFLTYLMISSPLSTLRDSFWIAAQKKMKKKLKIGVVVDQLLPGGVQIAAIEEVKNLHQLGHQAELLILMRKKNHFRFQSLVKEVPYRYLSDSYPWPFRSTVKFPILAFLSTLHLLSPFLAPRVIRKRAYDLLISHGTTTCFTTLALWRKRKIPYIAVVHDPIVFILKKVYAKTPLRFFFPIFIPLSFYLEKGFIKASLATIIDSNVHQKFIQENYQVEPVVLPLGRDVIPKIPPKRGSLILAVSRWQKEKNPELLLEILKEIPEARLLIAGVWTRQNDLEAFKKEARQMGIQARVKIVPQFETSELESLFKQARVWVHPNFEAFGLGGLEAASFGCPIIIPAGSGVTHLFRDGIDGFFPKKITVGEYKIYVKRLVNNERLAWQMGHSAWSRAKENYTWQKHTQKMLEIIERKLHV